MTPSAPRGALTIGQRSLHVPRQSGQAQSPASRAGSRSSGDLWSTHRPRSASLVVRPRLLSAAPSHSAPAPSSTASAEGLPAASAALSFIFDPPFTPVDGEARLAAGAPRRYVCRRCRASLFRSADAADARTGAAGLHPSGWPTFVEPWPSAAIEQRTVLQRSVVAQIRETDSQAGCARTVQPGPDAAVADLTSRDALQLAVPAAGVVPRGLPIEGDLVRRKGKQVALLTTRSWREACLRDENHRADPTVVLGVCAGCGTAVCHITQSAATGTRYVSTASCIAAEPCTPSTPPAALGVGTDASNPARHSPQVE